MGIYGILYWLFDTRVWRWQALSRLGVVRVPDLSGDWSGYVSSSFHEGETQHPASGRIRQSWTRIFVTLDTMQSRSRSLTGTVLVDDGSDTLAYEYLNEPRADADKRHTPTGARLDSRLLRKAQRRSWWASTTQVEEGRTWALYA